MHRNVCYIALLFKGQTLAVLLKWLDKISMLAQQALTAYYGVTDPHQDRSGTSAILITKPLLREKQVSIPLSAYIIAVTEGVAICCKRAAFPA